MGSGDTVVYACTVRPSFCMPSSPGTFLPGQDANMFWDFITLRPETTHQVSFLFSDRGIPDGHRHMNGYGSHTFKMVNKDGQPIYCKFHYKVCKTGWVGMR